MSIYSGIQRFYLATFIFVCSGCFAFDCLAQKDQANGSDSLRQVQHQFGLDPDQPLLNRVRPTSEQTLTRFREAGMSPSEHSLTAEERVQLEEVFAALPPLHQTVLKDHLRSINFLDNMPNTALTATLNYGSDFPVFDITVRAAIFKQTASEWMTEKERTCFNAENSSTQVHCEIGPLSALLYVMLHETTHMVDGALKLAQKPGFSNGIWDNRTIMVPKLSHTLLDSTRYRGGKPLSIYKAKELYQALSATPFVSLYSTSSWHEDLAEFLSVYHFTQKLKQPFRIVVRDNGKEVFVYEPMKSKLVQSRIKELERFYKPASKG